MYNSVEGNTLKMKTLITYSLIIIVKYALIKTSTLGAIVGDKTFGFGLGIRSVLLTRRGGREFRVVTQTQRPDSPYSNISLCH